MIGASGGDVCGAVGCDRGVTDFDYRCFTCAAFLHDPSRRRRGLSGLRIYVKTRLSWNSAVGPRLASSTCCTVARPDSLCPYTKRVGPM